MDIKEKVEILKNKSNVLKLKILKRYETFVLKALIINADGHIEVHDMISSAKLSGFAYQINEVWREINPKARLSFGKHSAYMYVGNCMLPLVFDEEAFNPASLSELVKKPIFNIDGEIDEAEAYKGAKLTGRGYFFAEPSNFKRIMGAKLVGELTQKTEDGLKKAVNWIIVLIVIGATIYFIMKSVFGIDILAASGG